MKKRLIYSAVVLGLGIVFGIVSRLSVSFSEWYAVTVYPLIVGTAGRFFGIFPFSFAEVLLILLIASALAGIVLLVVKLVKTRNKSTTVKSVLFSAGASLLCVAVSAFSIFVFNCGINYNRNTFLHNQGLSFEPSAVQSELERLMVFLTLLDEFYTVFPDSDSLEAAIKTDENGVFQLSGDLSVTAPAAMRNLAKQYPRLNVHYPHPKPVMLSGLMSDAFLLGMFVPYTIEANYNSIAPDSEKALTALHELAHVAGFMREEEANFISFLAARESGNPELVYAAYLYIFDYISVWITDELYRHLPDEYKALLEYFAGQTGVKWQVDFPASGFGKIQRYIFSYDLLPEQIGHDSWASFEFWSSRRQNTSYIFDEYGEVVDAVVTVNPFVEAFSSVSADLNDAYLKIQGQSDGVDSYGRMIDLVMATYLSEISEPVPIENRTNRTN
ncbi:MAG: DUF3810 domain-containing protein [Oscillospiraceae bacterium]|nr:DUF3810 domain-containing protein [Oscillospiraceae bacterium]